MIMMMTMMKGIKKQKNATFTDDLKNFKYSIKHNKKCSFLLFDK